MIDLNQMVDSFLDEAILAGKALTKIYEYVKQHLPLPAESAAPQE
ncbi:MAG TPA: hypothetical protein VIK39_01735 [Candidatus Angelobacter sp.]